MSPETTKYVGDLPNLVQMKDLTQEKVSTKFHAAVSLFDMPERRSKFHAVNTVIHKLL